MRSLLAVPAAFFAAIGLGISCPMAALQVVNPSRNLLSAEHFRTYYPFFALGDRIDTLAALGTVAAALTLASFLLWAARRMGPLEVLRRSRAGERYSLGWLVLLALQWSLLYLVGVAGVTGLVALHVLLRGGGPLPAAVLYGLAVVLPLGLASGVLLAARRAPGARSGRSAEPAGHRLVATLREDLQDLHETWRGGPWATALVSAATLAAWTLLFAPLADGFLSLAQGLHRQDSLVPPFLWSHFGPWEAMAFRSAVFGLLGLAIGLAMGGLTPGDDADPASPAPIPPGRYLAALLVAGGTLGTLAAVYHLFLVPTFQVGRDLRACFDLRPGRIEGRTVAWLDGPRPSHRLPDLEGWSTPENLDRVGRWMLEGTAPSALTRRAAAVLGNRALWDWDPDRALGWLQVEQRRQPNDSNLNHVLTSVLDATMPDPVRASAVQGLTDPARFAWPGPAAHDAVARLLHRYGREEEARRWLDQARPLGGGEVELPPVPQGTLQGLLTREGRPLAGVPVALFHDPEDPRRLTEKAVSRAESDRDLVAAEAIWTPGFFRAMDYEGLRDLYAVTTTDEAGRFRFEPLDDGFYLPAVRLPGGAVDWRVTGGTGRIHLRPGQRHRDLGTLDLRASRGESS